MTDDEGVRARIEKRLAGQDHKAVIGRVPGIEAIRQIAEGGVVQEIRDGRAGRGARIEVDVRAGEVCMRQRRRGND
jgi:hypothetical protein